MDKLVFAVGSEGVKDLGIVHLTKAELVELMASDDGMCIDCGVGYHSIVLLCKVANMNVNSRGRIKNHY